MAFPFSSFLPLSLLIIFISDVTEGFYLVFRHSWSIWNSKHIASVETPAIYATYACLSFWYNVPNKYSNLKVYVRDYTGRLTTIWSIDNFVPSMRVTNMFGWQKGSVSIFEDPPFTVCYPLITILSFFLSLVIISQYTY